MRRLNAPFRPGIVAGSALALLLSLPEARGVAGPTPTIIGSGSLQGECSPGHYDAGEMGGVSRIAAVIRERRGAGGPVLLVDAGDFGAVGDFEPDRKTAFLFDLMARLGYDAVTPGERELTRGLPALKAIYAAHPEVKVVSANVMDASGNRIWPEYAVLEKGGIRIGVTGVTGENFYAFNLSRGIQKVDDFTFEDPRSALQRVIPELRRQADVVVVLLHEARSGAGSLVAEVPRVDVAVVGHTPGSGTDVEAAGATLVLRPGMRGRYLPVLDLTLGADHRILGYAGKGRRLDENVARNPEVDGVVTSWVKAWNLRKSGAVSHRGSKPR